MVGAIQAAQVYVTQSITVDVTQRNTRSIQVNLVLKRLLRAKLIAKVYTGLPGVKQREPRPRTRRNFQRVPLVVTFLDPLGRRITLAERQHARSQHELSRVKFNERL
jgi:hypothetical protein